MPAKVVRLRRKIRPLTKTYAPSAPYVVLRVDQESGAMVYEIIDERPDSYRIVGVTDDDNGGNPYAKHDANQICRGLNMLVAYGLETLPKVKEEE